MYERFTDRARKVMQLANQAAHSFNHEYIGTEHMLLGLVKEGSGVAANVLKNMDISLPKIRLEVERIVMPGPAGDFKGDPAMKLPQTPRTKKVIEFAIKNARMLCHNYVGTEHLLLGLLEEEEGVASQILMNLGADAESVRQECLLLLGGVPKAVEEKAPPGLSYDECLLLLNGGVQQQQSDFFGADYYVKAIARIKEICNLPPKEAFDLIVATIMVYQHGVIAKGIIEKTKE